MGDKHVLILENNPEYVKLYTEILKGENFEVHHAGKAVDAFSLIKEQDFDLIITDQKIGRSLAKNVISKILAVCPRQRILLVTSNPSIHHLTEMFRAGINDYLIKPFDKQHFFKKVNHILDYAPKPVDIFFLENDELLTYLEITEKSRDLMIHKDIQSLSTRFLTLICEYTGVYFSILWVSNDDNGSFIRKGSVINPSLAKNVDLVNSLVQKTKKFQSKLDTNSMAVLDITQAMPKPNELHEGFYLGLAGKNAIEIIVYLSGKINNIPYTELDWAILKLLKEYSTIAYGNLAYKPDTAEVVDTSVTPARGKDIFNYTVEKEISKAKRYFRKLSLLSLEISNYDQIVEKLIIKDRSECIIRFENWIRNIIRETDLFIRANSGEYYLLLSETDYFGSLMLIKRCNILMRKEFNAEGFREWGIELNLDYGSATYPRDGESPLDLINVARKRRELRKNSMFNKLSLETYPFWEAINTLIGGPEDYQVPPSKLFRFINKAGKDTVIGFKSLFKDSWFHNVLFVLSDEIFMRDIESRSFLYIAEKDLEPICSMFGWFHNILNLNTKVYLLGGKIPETEIYTPNFTTIKVNDPEIKTHKFLLHLGEDYSYGFFCRMAKDGRWPGFHTNDPYLVEQLIYKLQTAYQLQNEFN